MRGARSNCYICYYCLSGTGMQPLQKMKILQKILWKFKISEKAMSKSSSVHFKGLAEVPWKPFAFDQRLRVPFNFFCIYRMFSKVSKSTFFTYVSFRTSV